MANTGVGFGLQAFGWPDGASPTAGQTAYTIRSSDTNVIFTGDLVVQSSGDPPCITRQSTTQFDTKVLGVFVGCKYYSPQAGSMVWNNYFPGSVATSCGTADVTAYVIDDPDSYFIARGSTGAAITSTMIGLNIALLSSFTGNTATGRSLMRLESTSGTISASLPLRLVDLYSNHAPPGAEGCDNTAASNIAIVAPNNWTRKTMTGLLST